jgi:alkyldihydroxyacetonephosphate synthase
MTEPIAHTARDRWADEPAALPEAALRWLESRIGAGARPTPAKDVEPPVPDSALPADVRTELVELLGADAVRTDPADRLAHAGGLSYLDLLTRREGGELPVPDAVVAPANPGQVQRLLEVCARRRIGVVPFGGGTSVVGGVAAVRGELPAVLALDLSRLDRLVTVDEESRLAVLQAGVIGPDAEKMLARHGFTLGHVPQSFERATIGGFAATRSAGQQSAGYGRFDEMVRGLRVATPRGEWRLGVAPASAAGPDLAGLVLGSEGAFGVITEVTVRVRPRPIEQRYQGVMLGGWARGVAAVRALAQQGVPADVTRLSDPDETTMSLALAGGWKTRAAQGYLAARGVREPCLLVLGWDAASKTELATKRAATLHALAKFHPVRLGDGPGESWRHNRFAGPRQRDALLEHGICVETLETATHWSTLTELREAVRQALRGALGRSALIACHISHIYETGASLYFTVLAARPRGAAAAREQWQRAKAAASEAIGGLGTITHHHAVGLDHAPYLQREVGALGMDVLAAVKDTLDPAGILNPGKLIRRS